MRVVFFTNSYKPTISGVVTSISHYRRGLVEAGHEVSLIAPRYDDYRDQEPYVFRFPAIDLNDAANISIAMPFKSLMGPTLWGIQPQLVHSQHPILMGDIGAAFAQELGIPLVFTFHTRYEQYIQQYIPIAPELSGKVVDTILRRYLEKCSHVVVPTPSIRRLVEAYDLDLPVTVIPTPVDLRDYEALEPARVRQQWGLAGKEMLLFVGRLSAEKNLDFLIETFVAIRAERPRAHLVIVGDGPERKKLEKLAERLAVSSQIHFVGTVEHCEVPHYAAAADLFVFPSTTETQGLVLVESMAAGTPVVAISAPGPVDVLSVGGGLLVKGGARAFARGVIALLADPPRRQALGEEAQRVARRYTIPFAVEQLVRVYERVIEDYQRED